MSKKIKASELFEEVQIDLWGGMFKLREATRSVEEKVRQHQEEFDALDDDCPLEEAIEPLCKILDTVLEPLGDEKGKKVRAKTIIDREFKADKIGMSHVLALSNKMAQAAIERPT